MVPERLDARSWDRIAGGNIGKGWLAIIRRAT